VARGWRGVDAAALDDVVVGLAGSCRSQQIQHVGPTAGGRGEAGIWGAAPPCSHMSAWPGTSRGRRLRGCDGTQDSSSRVCVFVGATLMPGACPAAA
jgi:hypothetical protein